MKGKDKQQITEEERLRLQEEERKRKQEERKQEARTEAKGCLWEFMYGSGNFVWQIVTGLWKVISIPFRVIIKIINFFD